MIDQMISRREFLKLAGAASLSLPLDNLIRSKSLTPKSNLPNILIIYFDALSARNMSLYGYRRLTTPNLEKFAGRSFVFHRHHSAGNFTTTSTASFLTGVYPWSHRALQLRGYLSPSFFERNIYKLLEGKYYRFAYTHNLLVYFLLFQLKKNIDDLIEISTNCLGNDSFVEKMLQIDYNIAYQAESLMFWKKFNASSSMYLWLSDWLKRIFIKSSLARGNQNFPYGLPLVYDDDMLGIMYFRLEDTFNWLLDMVDRIPQPYFGYVHVIPPHDPYNTRNEFVNKFSDGWLPRTKTRHFFQGIAPDDVIAQDNQRYDEYILYADAEFGRLVDSLKASGVLDNTILIVSSDHGELHERGITGHVTPVLYEPVTHIPLMISLPGQSERKDIYQLTSTVDLLPTILGLIGLEVPEWCEGDFLPGMDLAKESVVKSKYTIEAKSNPYRKALKKASFAIYKDQYKLTHYLGYEGFEETYELYDLDHDPEELDNIYSSDDPTSKLLIQELADQLRLKDIH